MMASSTVVPFAVTRAYQVPIDYTWSGYTATAPTRVGGTSDLAIQTDGVDTTFHQFVSYETSDAFDVMRYMDVLSWDFTTDPGLGTPKAVCLQIRWQTDPAAFGIAPTGARQWHTTASVVGTSDVLQHSNGGRGTDAIKRLEGCTQASWVTSRYFWAEVDDADPTDGGNWLDGEFTDLSCLTGPGLRMSAYMMSVQEDLPHPIFADIAEGRLVVSYGDPGVDLLMQGEMLTQTGERPIYTTGLLRAAPRSAPQPPTPQVATITADWVSRYGGDGTQTGDPGVGQGVLDRDDLGDPDPAGRGHERSLVGFTVDLPADADITVAYLRVSWTRWWYANGVGNLVLGWHTHDTAPAEWSPGGGTAQLSSHDVQQLVLEVPLQWVNMAVAGGTFRGLTVGPGLNDGPLYAGSTTADPDQWTLEIHYMAGVR